MTKQMTIDMDALLERATADCLDSSDLGEFCAALIRRIITLETAMHALMNASVAVEDGRILCVICGDRGGAHAADCAAFTLQRLLEVP
jgi:hypothetical protein